MRLNIELAQEKVAVVVRGLWISPGCVGRGRTSLHRLVVEQS